MPEVNIGASIASQNQHASYKVDSSVTDSATDQKETKWLNSDWPKYLGYYRKIPELKQAVDAKARWTVGKGYKADPITTIILDKVTGWGKETFNTILENMIRTMILGGDSFAEIILDDNGFLLNLKVLDPGSIAIYADSKGRILRYEQESKVKGKAAKVFQPEQILHFCKDRIADEIHGQSVVPSVETVILMRNEAMDDWKRVLHRNIDPLWIYHLDTDDADRINDIKRKIDAARAKGENMYIPKGVIVPELVATAQQAGLNPLEWIDSLNRYFYQAVGMPDIVLGSSTNLTEASAKIAYLAFEQTVEEDQLYIEEQVLAQLNLEINLEFPASLKNELLQSQGATEEIAVEMQNPNTPSNLQAQSAGVNPPQIRPQEAAFEQNDLQTEIEGRK